MGRSALKRPEPAESAEAPAVEPSKASAKPKSPPRSRRSAVVKQPAAQKERAAPKSKSTPKSAAAKTATSPAPEAPKTSKAASPKPAASPKAPPKAAKASPKRQTKAKPVGTTPAKPARAKASPAPKPMPAPKSTPKTEAASGAKSDAPRPKATRPDPAKPEASSQGPHGGAQGAEAENPFLTPDVEAFAANMAKLWEQGGKAMSAYMRPREDGRRSATPNNAEIVDLARTLGQVVERWMKDPARVAEAQRAFTSGFFELWSSTLKRLSGEEAEPVVKPDPKDNRFKDPQWTEHPVFDFLKQAYLHASNWADRMVEEADDLDPVTRHKATFYVKLLAGAASPSNFLPTNPELIRETIASKGENLVRGMKMLAEDIDAGSGDLRIRQTDGSNFEVGRNLAVTPGKVVFRNHLFELIQYAPTTEMVRTRPIVIVPPWINKFYVLDLTPEKSMIAWAVSQGLTVFCISWVNPDSRHAKLGFDEYMRDGVMTAVDVAREISGADQVDTTGYCVGGTLLAVTLAYMAAAGDNRIASATLMTTQVDFTHAGDLKVFVDEDQISAVEAKMAEAGYLEGSSMANAFNMIRSNDMIWPYVVNNYMRGRAPFPFDLLYWNSDATRMPAANHSFYLRGCYLNNDLAHRRMKVGGKLLDLSKVTIPVYHLATREDHIAPAKSVFLGAQLFGGPTRFVLAGSGHIAGVVNPPAKMKYQHWVGGDVKGELSHWLDGAEERPGSWWPDWRAWLAAMDATMVPARTPGEGPYPALEDAPGSYVKVKS
jgi:polyhydroxyalkanoate synthase